MRHFFSFLLLLTSASVSALEVVDLRWGFDGGVRAGRFNPLAIRIANPALVAFDGEVSLQRSPDLGGVGCPLQIAVYLEPSGERWLRFAPFVFAVPENWELRWGPRPVDAMTISASALAKPARLFFTADPSASQIELPAFPEALLPSSVSLMDGLAVAGLENVPEWTILQQDAFADWLRRGGHLHLTDAADFDGPLALLNNPAAAFRFGAGMVQRHSDVAAIAQAAALSLGIPDQFPLNKARGTEQILGNLVSLAHPAHNWYFIILLVLAYVALIGPVNFLLSRRLSDHRIALAFFIMCTIAFTALIGVAGQRGYDTLSGTRTFTYAREMGDHRYDTRKWASIFTADGDQFRIRHEQPTFYSAATRFETVEGIIRNGVDGSFEIGVPMYSSRPFFSRGVRVHQRPEPRLEWSQLQDGQLSEIQVADAGNPIAAWALHGADCHLLQVTDGSLQIRETLSVAEFANRWRKRFDRPYRYGHAGRPHETVMRAIAERLIQDELLRNPLPGHISLLLLAPTPLDFQLKEEEGGLETGLTLFHYGLPERPFTASEP
ncbi:MAG: uncharacterized membrane protein YhaH (DUF805 family) [Rhodothermales bacterium]|jgi:uncharacterized membrane protein YhaH (DUF805 family)